MWRKRRRSKRKQQELTFHLSVPDKRERIKRHYCFQCTHYLNPGCHQSFRCIFDPVDKEKAVMEKSLKHRVMEAIVKDGKLDENIIEEVVQQRKVKREIELVLSSIERELTDIQNLKAQIVEKEKKVAEYKADLNTVLTDSKELLEGSGQFLLENGDG